MWQSELTTTSKHRATRDGEIDDTRQRLAVDKLETMTGIKPVVGNGAGKNREAALAI